MLICWYIESKKVTFYAGKKKLTKYYYADMLHSK